MSKEERTKFFDKHMIILGSASMHPRGAKMVLKGTGMNCHITAYVKKNTSDDKVKIGISIAGKEKKPLYYQRQSANDYESIKKALSLLLAKIK